MNDVCSNAYTNVQCLYIHMNIWISPVVISPSFRTHLVLSSFVSVTSTGPLYTLSHATHIIMPMWARKKIIFEHNIECVASRARSFSLCVYSYNIPNRIVCGNFVHSHSVMCVFVQVIIQAETKQKHLSMCIVDRLSRLIIRNGWRSY